MGFNIILNNSRGTNPGMDLIYCRKEDSCIEADKQDNPATPPVKP